MNSPKGTRWTLAYSSGELVRAFGDHEAGAVLFDGVAEVGAGVEEP